MRVNGIFHTILRLAAVISATLTFSFCAPKDPDLGIEADEEGINYTPHGNRQAMKETRRVLLFYECGFNSLNYDLETNMTVDLPEGYIPGNGRHDDVVLVYSKLAINANYKAVPSYLRRIYKDHEGNIVSDTLKTYPSSVVASSGETMRDVLNLVHSSFPAKGYGMVFSSHGSGWLPTGYFNNPSAFERNHKLSGKRMSKSNRVLGVPSGDMEHDDPYAWMVRSIGQDKMASGDVEMSVTEFIEGIPFHLDYLLFDMCFSGGIEIAYALKDKVDYIGVSPAEVLAAGTYDYTKITDFLLRGTSPDLTGLFNFLVVAFVISSVIRLAELLGDQRMIGKGHRLSAVILLSLLGSLILNILPALFHMDMSDKTTGIIGLVSALAAVLAYILYLGFLRNAVKMLKK